MATGSLIVLATEMEAQTGHSVMQPDATAQQLADRVARNGWDTFSARIAVRRQMIAPDGAPVGPAPATTEYTWERTRTTRGWKTTMTMVGATPVRVRARAGMVTLPDAPAVVKTEDAGDGSAPRFWDRNGAEIKMPSPEVQARVMGPEAITRGASMAETSLQGAQGIQALPQGVADDWIDALIMPAAKRGQRLAAFERQFGPSRGVVRGLSRHLRRQGDGEREVLVDEAIGVPVEANLIANGKLVAHSTFAYERAASGIVLRRGVRSERTLSASDRTRMVTEVTFNDMTVEQRGGR